MNVSSPVCQRKATTILEPSWWSKTCWFGHYNWESSWSSSKALVAFRIGKADGYKCQTLTWCYPAISCAHKPWQVIHSHKAVDWFKKYTLKSQVLVKMGIAIDSMSYFTRMGEMCKEVTHYSLWGSWTSFYLTGTWGCLQYNYQQSTIQIATKHNKVHKATFKTNNLKLGVGSRRTEIR